MGEITTYSQFELESDRCQCCGEKTDEILINTGTCIDCIEEQKFYDETMKGI